MEGSISSTSNLREESTHMSKDSPEVFPTVSTRVVQTEASQDSVVGEDGNIRSEFISSKSGDGSTPLLNDLLGNGRAGDTTPKGHDSPHIGRQIDIIQGRFLCVK